MKTEHSETKPKIALRQEPEAWEAGRQAGRSGAPHAPPAGIDGLSWTSGYIEGKAERTNPHTYRPA